MRGCRMQASAWIAVVGFAALASGCRIKSSLADEAPPLSQVKPENGGALVAKPFSEIPEPAA